MIEEARRGRPCGCPSWAPREVWEAFRNWKDVRSRRQHAPVRSGFCWYVVHVHRAQLAPGVRALAERHLPAEQEETRRRVFALEDLPAMLQSVTSR